MPRRRYRGGDSVPAILDLAAKMEGLGRRRHRRRRGGLAPLAALAIVKGVHETAKAIKPFSRLENALTSSGIKGQLDRTFGNNPLYKGAKAVGNFLTKTLGYGARSRSRRHRRGGNITLVHSHLREHPSGTGLVRVRRHLRRI